MFTTNISPKSDVIVPLPNFAMHCRENENLCGKSGYLYENKDKDNDLEELQNRCCGEVNENDELEQLEREFFEVFQKIKQHNKKRIYKTTQDIYKLFKK